MVFLTPLPKIGCPIFLEIRNPWDKESLDRCGQQHRYHSRVDQEYQKPNFFEKRKKSSKTQKLKKVQRYANISDTPFDQRFLIHREAWFGPCFVRQNQEKKLIFFCAAILDHFFSLLFPKDSESLKILDIRLREVGAKRPLNDTSKVNTRTDTSTNRHTDGYFDLQKASAQRADAFKILRKISARKSKYDKT